MQEPWELHWRDYYYLLGLRPSAEPEAVEGAAKQLLAKYHPDKSGTGNTELFKQINEAREVLTDPVRRRRYDADYKRRASKQKQSHKSPTPSESQ
jgi:curved DNA-binding protein